MKWVGENCRYGRTGREKHFEITSDLNRQSIILDGEKRYSELSKGKRYLGNPRIAF